MKNRTEAEHVTVLGCHDDGAGILDLASILGHPMRSAVIVPLPTATEEGTFLSRSGTLSAGMVLPTCNHCHPHAF